MFRQTRQAEAIAADWGIDAALLDGIDWEVETIDGSDGQVYGYRVRFDQSTDRAILAQIGLEADEFSRELSMRALEEGDEFELEEQTPRSGKRRRAYYIDEDRFTPSQFRRLSRHRKVEAMVQWFHENYEDPAVRTPYESREGGYQWIWGGPYDARDQIGDEFSDIAEESAIEQAVAEVTRDGLFDWAPKEQRGDYDQGYEADDGVYAIDEPLPDISEFLDDHESENQNEFPVLPRGQAYLVDEKGRGITDEFGRRLIVDVPPSSSAVDSASLNEHDPDSPTDAGASHVDSSVGKVPNSPHQAGDIDVLRSEMLDRLDNLEILIRQQMRTAPHRGHNHPPELLDIEQPVTQTQLVEVVAAIVEIRREADSSAPTPANVVAQVSVFQRIAAFLRNGPGFLVSAAVSGVIGDIAVDTYKTHQQSVYEALVQAADAVMTWVHHLPSPF